MMAAALDQVPFLECGLATRSLDHASTSGDGFVLCPNRIGGILAVFDGLGHGAEAQNAADIAGRVISSNANDTLISLVRKSDEALRSTRGVALSLMIFNRADESMGWLAVGNVEAVLLRADQAVVPRKEHIVMRGGVVGSRLPPLQAMVTTVNHGDVLICATDGIRRGFSERLDISQSPQKIADHILSGWGKADDDALVFAARYIGGGRWFAGA